METGMFMGMQNLSVMPGLGILLGTFREQQWRCLE